MLASDTFACPHSGSSLRALRARDSRKLAALGQQLAAQPVPTRPVPLAPPGMAHRAALQPGARSERFGTAIPTSIITQARQLAGPYMYRGSPTHRMRSKTEHGGQDGRSQGADTPFKVRDTVSQPKMHESPCEAPSHPNPALPTRSATFVDPIRRGDSDLSDYPGRSMQPTLLPTRQG